MKIIHKSKPIMRILTEEFINKQYTFRWPPIKKFNNKYCLSAYIDHLIIIQYISGESRYGPPRYRIYCMVTVPRKGIYLISVDGGTNCPIECIASYYDHMSAYKVGEIYVKPNIL